MIEETARHCGHLDLTRELIDGRGRALGQGELDPDAPSWASSQRLRSSLPP